MGRFETASSDVLIRRSVSPEASRTDFMRDIVGFRERSQCLAISGGVALKVGHADSDWILPRGRALRAAADFHGGRTCFPANGPLRGITACSQSRLQPAYVRHART